MDRGLYQKGLILALLLAGCPFAVCSQTDNRQWRDSLNALNRRIAVSAYSTDLHLRKAAVNLELQQWEYAVDEYTLILRHEAANLSALFYRAYAYTHLRRYDLAKNDYERVIAQVPGNKESRLGLAFVFQSMGRRNDALTQLNAAVEFHPQDAEVYVARATFETDIKQYAPALYDWEEAIRCSPDNVEYRLSYVDVLMLSGDRSKAKRELDNLSGRGVAASVLHPFYARLKK